MDWKSPIAVVTGASTGIGRATVLEMARRGATVAAVARTAANLDRLATEAANLPGRLVTRALDVGDAEAVSSAFAELERELGRIDLLVNNAGTGSYGPFLRTSPAEFAAVHRTNYLGAVHCTLAVLPGMIARRSGHVVNVSSPSSFAPPPGQAAYASSKAALDAFSESLLLEVREQGVRVSIVYPGHVITPLTINLFKDQPLPPKAVQMTAERVAAGILQAVESGCFRLYLPWFVGLTPLVKSVAPEFVRRQTVRAQPLGKS